MAGSGGSGWSDDPRSEDRLASDPDAVQRRRRKAAIITSAVVIAAVAIALGAGRLTYPNGSGAGSTGPLDIPPLPTTVPGALPMSPPGPGGGPDVPFAPSGSAYLQVVVAGTAKAGSAGAVTIATATLDNETGALIDIPGSCPDWLQLELAGVPPPTTTAPAGCEASELPLGFSQYRVAIALPATTGTYAVTAVGLPPGIHLVQPPSITVTG